MIGYWGDIEPVSVPSRAPGIVETVLLGPQWTLDDSPVRPIVALTVAGLVPGIALGFGLRSVQRGAR